MMPSINVKEDVVLDELLELQAAELRLSGFYEFLRSNPEARDGKREFINLLADVNRRAEQVERLLELIPTATPTSQQLVA